MSYELNNGHIYEYQTPATLNQAAPVQNTWYTLLDTTTNARIYEIAINIEDDNETLEVQATIDGETMQAVSLAANHSTEHWCYKRASAIGQNDAIAITSTDALNKQAAFILEGKSVKIEVRKTTAAGAGSLTRS